MSQLLTVFNGLVLVNHGTAWTTLFLPGLPCVFSYGNTHICCVICDKTDMKQQTCTYKYPLFMIYLTRSLFPYFFIIIPECAFMNLYRTIYLHTHTHTTEYYLTFCVYIFLFNKNEKSISSSVLNYIFLFCKWNNIYENRENN